MTTRDGTLAATLFGALFAASSCRCDGDRGVAPEAGATASAEMSAEVSAAPAATLPAGDWARAAGDRTAAMGLARRHDALTLMGVAAGADASAASGALAALAFASDGELVLAQIGLLARESADRRAAALEAIVALARAPALGERYDPSAVRACSAHLDALSRDAALARPHRALAVSALRAFVRHGWVDPGAITTELDPATR